MNAVVRWVLRHRQCTYNEITSNGILDATLVDGNGIGLNADDARRSSAAQQEFSVSTGGETVCMLTFCGKKWGRARKIHSLDLYIGVSHTSMSLPRLYRRWDCFAWATSFDRYMQMRASEHARRTCGDILLWALDGTASLYCKSLGPVGVDYR